MIKKGFTVLLMLAVVLSAMVVPTTQEAQAAGVTYYVDGASGHDTSGDGSSGSPWKTIGKAASVAQAGDTVKIRSGTYRETVTPANSGTAGNYIASRRTREQTLQSAAPNSSPAAGACTRAIRIKQRLP